MTEAFTDDTLLGGRVTLRQPRDGFRATSDAVFLAAALTAAPGEKLLDVGVGAGAALLAAAARMPACNFVGIDTDAEALGYARSNVATNGWADRVVLCHTDLADIAAVPAPAYHHVFSNPPYYANGSGRLSPVAARTRARHAGQIPLATWVQLCAAAASRSLTLVLPADREAEALGALPPGFSVTRVLPLAAHAGKRPTRVIVQSWKEGGGRGVVRLQPFIIHKLGGGFSAAADSILRAGAPLSLAG